MTRARSSPLGPAILASVAISVFVSLVGCSGAGTAPQAALPARPRSSGGKGGRGVKVHAPALRATRFAVVPAGTFGPYVGQRAEGVIAAWAAEVDGKRRWLTSPLGEAGPARDPKAIADAATEVDLVALRALGAAGTRNFVLLSSSREFSGERVDAIALGLKGELAGGPTPIAQSLSDVVWVDAVTTATGAIAMWAVRRDDRADLYGVELGSSGELKDRPGLLVEGARAWQVVPVSSGAAIAVVAAGKGRSESGPVRVEYVDAQGHVEKKSLVVTEAGTAEPDLDVARMGDRLVLAWSDHRGLEPRLFGAAVDGRGALVRPPGPLGRPFGAQSVLRIVPPFKAGSTAFLAWENRVEQPAAGRRVRLAALSSDGVLADQSTLLEMTAPEGVPELAASAKGVAALTLAAACRRGASCEADRPSPTFVELDGALAPAATEPVRLSELGGRTADFVWGLTCRESGCLALAAAPENPAPVFSVNMTSLSNDWQPVTRRTSEAPPPRAAWIEAVAKSDSVAEISAARVGSTSAVAWVSDFDPSTPFVRSKTAAPDGKYEPIRATLGLRLLPDRGSPVEPVILSYRAHSPGGVSLSAGDEGSGQVLLGWAGIDNKEPQAFATLVGPDGKKLAQKMLSHTKGGVSDVATAFVGDGWVVAWVDEARGASEVHLTKVDRKLNPVLQERRLGTEPSVATGVRLLSQGDHVVAVWSDARGPASGVADVFAARMSAKDLSLIGPERPVARTPAHSRSPAITPLGEGSVVAWIEDPAPGSATTASSLVVTQLDSGAEPVAGSTLEMELLGSAEGAGITCGKESCRIVATVSTAAGGDLEGLEWRPGAEARVARLVDLGARPRAAAPALVGGDCFYADPNRAGDARIRRVGIDW